MPKDLGVTEGKGLGGHDVDPLQENHQECQEGGRGGWQEGGREGGRGGWQEEGREGGIRGGQGEGSCRVNRAFFV